MKQRLLVALGACAFFAAAAAGAQGTKWHPGHYVTLAGSAKANLRVHLTHIAELRDEPAVEGFTVLFRWYDLERALGDYDFSLIDAYLDALEGSSPKKRLIVRIVDRKFDTTDASAIVPEYLRKNAAYNGGVVRSRSGYVARLWEEPVMGRLVSLYQAIARRYDSDPRFEGFFTAETTLSFDDSDAPSGYSHERLAGQYVRFIKAVKPTMPKSNLFLDTNWLGSPTIMSALIQEARDAGVGAGGSNVVPGKLTAGQSAITGVYGADYSLELPIANAVESGELGGELGSFLPEQIASYAYDVLKTHYLFWSRNTWAGTARQRWETGILPFLRTNPPTRTRCPNVYGICVSGDEPIGTKPTNSRPTVWAGADSAQRVKQAVALAGSVTDDGLPGPLASVAWSQVSGPQKAVFADAKSPKSQVTFPAAGTYVLRLTASDGELSARDDVAVTVSGTASSSPPPASAAPATPPPSSAPASPPPSGAPATPPPSAALAPPSAPSPEEETAAASPPPESSTPSSALPSASVGGGGSFGWIEVLLIGLAALGRRRWWSASPPRSRSS
jgi:hypothetical protein